MSQELPPPSPGPWAPGEAPGHDAWPPPHPSAAPPWLFGLRRSAAAIAALACLMAVGAVGGFLITRSLTGSPVAAATSASGSGTITSPSPAPSFRAGPGGVHGLPGMNLLQDAASYIGVNEQTLETDLQNGQSLAQVATASGKTASGLISSLVGDETTAINSLVTSGKITSSQATKLESNLTQMVTAVVNGTHLSSPPVAGPGGSAEQAALQAAAAAIGNGVTTSDLAADLAQGQSVAAVATAHGVSVSSVISAVTAAVDKQISSLESSGTITSAQAGNLTALVPSRMSEWVNDTYPGWPLGTVGTGGGHGAPFLGGPWGRGPLVSPSASPSAG